MKRAPDAHKGDCGRVLVVAGSTGLTGAAFLTAKAALRTGAGIVVTACPDVVQPVLATKHTCVMVRPFPSTKSGSLALEALEPILELAQGFDAVALGPGLGRDRQTAKLARRLALGLQGKLVLDADGLNAFEERAELLQTLGAEAVLTPHPGELARLTGRSTKEIQEDRASAARALVREIKGVLVLKGKGTLVAKEGERLHENRTGNPGMATAGAGDVLTGVIAALLAGGLSAWEAAVLGVYLHGRAGDMAAEILGPVAVPLIATDILDEIQHAVSEQLLLEGPGNWTEGRWRFGPVWRDEPGTKELLA
ncbi:NAD(P)H-hydrate dehydratase [bacterium]|nr:NAD(P)H-hydrate dehydratase [bacterium]